MSDPDDIEALFLEIDANLSGFWTRDHLAERRIEIQRLAPTASEMLGLRVNYADGHPEGQTNALLEGWVPFGSYDAVIYPRGHIAVEYAFSSHADMVTMIPLYRLRNWWREESLFEPPSDDQFSEFDACLTSLGFHVVDYEDTLRPYSGERTHPMNPDLLWGDEHWGDFTWNQVLFR